MKNWRQFVLSTSINTYIITQIILEFWLVHAYDLLEDRRIDDANNTLSLSFQNLDNILRD